jgi:hypothetical protein
MVSLSLDVAQRRRAGAAGSNLQPIYAPCQVTDQYRKVTLW